jgi:hypothetical protein
MSSSPRNGLFVYLHLPLTAQSVFFTGLQIQEGFFKSEFIPTTNRYPFDATPKCCSGRSAAAEARLGF